MVSAFILGKDGLPRIDKDPAAALDYAIDWSDWLGADVIAASVWTVTPPDGGLTASLPGVSGSQARVWLSGGTAGQVVRVTNRITTGLGRIDERSFNVRLVER